MNTPTTVHVRLVKKHFHQSSSGHIYKSGPEYDTNRTLCGGPMTEFDVSPAEGRKMKDDSRWVLCPACRRAL